MMKPDSQPHLPLLEMQSEVGEGGQLLEAALPKPQRANLRLELQGLRAVAITAVLLFHQWSSVFKTGYLGVDVFFVISGYLMCHLLSRRMPLGAVEIVDFYFRRIKRIVPIYLFVVGLTVFVAKHYVSPLDYQQLVDEAVPSLLFYSNSPAVHKAGYFDLRSQYFFLLHTWSLSTEMQFYLIVPILFLIAQRITRIHFVWFLGILLFALSLLRQCLSDGMARHMPLEGRIWQFLSGFLAHIIYERSSAIQENIPLRMLSGRSWLLRPFADLLIIAVLSTLLLFEFITGSQFMRICVILCAVLFISIPDNEQSWLSADALISLGDASYSIYLIHWPIFTLHKFIAEEVNKSKSEAPYIEGTYLIAVSVVFGYVLEKCWSKFSKHLKSWSSLLITLLVMYAVIGVVLWDVSKNAIQIGVPAADEAASPIPNDVSSVSGNGSVDKYAQQTEELWASRAHPLPLTSKVARLYNIDGAHYGIHRLACPNRTPVLPTTNNIEGSLVGDVCHEKGNGTKNVVIIGNSHAYMAYYGISRHFRDLAANITMRAMSACTPVPEQYQQPTFGAEYQKNCVKFIHSTSEMFQHWEHPVDIIIVLYGFDFLPDPGNFTNNGTDSVFAFMQDHYQKLSNVAREIVFVPSMMVRFDENPMKVTLEKLLKNETIGEVGEPLEKQLTYLPNIRHRIEHIKCPKCRVMNWHNLWCRAHEGTFCQTVEPIRRISYFLDWHHPTPYGSMLLGQYLRQTYDSFAKK